MFLQNVTDKGNVHGGYTHQESTITLLQVSQPYSPYYYRCGCYFAGTLRFKVVSVSFDSNQFKLGCCQWQRSGHRCPKGVLGEEINWLDGASRRVISRGSMIHSFSHHKRLPLSSCS